MSNRELAKALIDQIPESRLLYVVAYLQGAAVPDETPNAETLEAIEEVRRMKSNPELGKTYTDVDLMMKELLA